VVLKVVTMAEMRFEVLLEVERTGLTVTEVCRRYGISRNTYYRYRRRYLAEGFRRLGGSVATAASAGEPDHRRARATDL